MHFRNQQLSFPGCEYLTLILYIGVLLSTTALPQTYYDPSTHVHRNRILLSGDCHPNPGPNYKFPCGVCEKPCKSNQNCIACDSCDTWFHVKCMNMPLPVFKGTHNVSWICFQCGVPNFSTSLFDTVLAESLPTRNSFSSIEEAAPSPPASNSSRVFQSPTSTGSSYCSSFESQIGSPLHTSSPNRGNPRPPLQNTMRILVINFQSIRAKKTPFWLLLTECNPDIIIGSETWLSPGIYEREILPCGYHIVARKDRKGSPHGGVLIATKKANNSLAFLRRNLYNCPSHTKAQSYQTLVRPILEYASSAWDPYTQSSINKLEGVQRRAARFVTGDYRTTSSVSEMISNLGWETLQERRTEAKMVMMYRITYGLIDISATSLLLPATLSTRGNSMRYLQPFCRTDAYRCSFFPSGIRLWNQLPECVVTAPTFETFKGGLPGHY